MRTVLIIGIGAGDPDYMTVQAINALNRLDTIFVINKGPRKDGLAQLRATICERYMTGSYRVVEIEDPDRDRASSDYEDAVAAWRQQRLERYRSALRGELAPDGIGGFLVWGDPSLYDGTAAMIEAIASSGEPALRYEVIPGISSAQALAARHRVPLNRVGEDVHITTGRRVASGLLPGQDNAVVMLDGGQAFSQLRGQDFDIYWGAYVGMDDEILISGQIDDVASEIQAARQDARARVGWIMDTYILRRRRH